MLKPRDAVNVAMRVMEFWEQVAPPTPTKGCRFWTGYVNDDGYGQFFWLGKMVGAHELALTFTTGEIRLAELDTCHSCGNRQCCEPTHLRFDTRASNVADSIQHGTFRQPPRKVTADQARLIRLRAERGATEQLLAEQYGLSVSGISAITTGRNWPHAGGPIRPRRRPGRPTKRSH